jgi:hypothetical protein
MKTNSRTIKTIKVNKKIRLYLSMGGDSEEYKNKVIELVCYNLEVAEESVLRRTRRKEFVMARVLIAHFLSAAYSSHREVAEKMSILTGKGVGDHSIIIHYAHCLLNEWDKYEGFVEIIGAGILNHYNLNDVVTSLNVKDRINKAVEDILHITKHHCKDKNDKDYWDQLFNVWHLNNNQGLIKVGDIQVIKFR